MANYKGHITGGVVAFATMLVLRVPQHFAQQPSMSMSGLWLALTLFGALFPDIDIHSKGRILWYRILAVCAFGAFCFRRHLLFAPLLALSLAPFFLKHRGITHRWWFLAGIAFACAISISAFTAEFRVPALVGSLFFTAGAFSHIVLDYWPYFLVPKKNKFRLFK